MTALEVDFRYLSPEPDRHGNERLYVRRYGLRVRIRARKGTAAFATAYAKALAQLEERKTATVVARPARSPWPHKSFGWLAMKYFASAEFQERDPESQATRRRVIEACLQEPHTDDDPEPMGNCPLAYLTPMKIKRLRDLKKGLPGAANNRRKYISAMCGWAIEENLMSTNPVRDVRRKKYATNGFYTWSLEDLRRFLVRHEQGSKARLLLGLLLFLGVRRGDVVRLGPQDLATVTTLNEKGEPVPSQVIRFTPNKTRHQRVIESEKPVLPVLAHIIATSPIGTKAFLETSFGKPFTAKGLGNYMRDRCDEAGLRQCSAHGLRKLGATIAAELEATEHQLMAMFDWATPAQAAVYTRAASRARLARKGMPLLSVLKFGIDMPAEGGVH